MSPSGGAEEAELCELVAAALERGGVLAGVRAQLRAAVHRALDQEHQLRAPLSPPVSALTPVTSLALQLALELLDALQLKRSAATLRAESPGLTLSPSATLAQQLSLPPAPAQVPLLVRLVQTRQPGSDCDTTFTSDSSSEAPDKLVDTTQSSDKTLPDNSSVSEEVTSNHENSDANLNQPESAVSIPSQITNIEKSKNSTSPENQASFDTFSSESKKSIISEINNVKTLSSRDSSKITEISQNDNTSAIPSEYSRKTDAFDESISEEIISPDTSANDPS